MLHWKRCIAMTAGLVVAAGLLWSSGAQARKPRETRARAASGPPYELVTKVTNIRIEDPYGKTVPPNGPLPPVHFTLYASGVVPYSNYTDPILVLKSKKPDANGYLTYYFAARTPEDGSEGEPSPIKTYVFNFDPQGARYVRVVAETNEMTGP